jgi:hypothetical protein
MSKSCASCAHYVSVKSEAQPVEQGFCRFWPPTVRVNADGSLGSSFPPVRAEWRCAQHEPSVRTAARKAARAPAPAETMNGFERAT